MPSASISTYLKPAAAAAGGAWTYEGGEVTARDTAATSNTLMVTITGLTIAAVNPIIVFTRWKSGTGASTFRSGGVSHLNTTSFSSALKDVGYDSGNVFSTGWMMESITSREDTFANSGFQISGGYYDSAAYWEMQHGFPNVAEHDDWDDNEITSIGISGRVGNTAVTLTLKGVYIYSLAVA